MEDRVSPCARTRAASGSRTNRSATMAGFADAVPKLRVPVLVQHGTADSLVPLAAVKPLYDRLGSPKLRTVRLYEGLYHEAYNEPERDRVIADLEAWLDSHR